jgi:tRNA threonylcarbamoyladenosine biosynthesis protein TsaB
MQDEGKMKILAIDTSNWPLGVAVIEDGKLLGEINTHLTKNHSLRLMPAVESLLAQLNIAPNQLAGITVAKGPGSYTGVRIGVTTAKTLAWSLGVPIIGISSLQVIAQNRLDFDGIIVPLFDARRGQAYRGMYRLDPYSQIAAPVEEDRLQLVQDLLQDLKQQGESLLFIGEGVQIHAELIKQQLSDQASIARPIDHLPRASQLAYVGWKEWDKKIEEVHTFAPEYLQLAEAEARWLANQAGSC